MNDGVAYGSPHIGSPITSLHCAGCDDEPPEANAHRRPGRRSGRASVFALVVHRKIARNDIADRNTSGNSRESSTRLAFCRTSTGRTAGPSLLVSASGFFLADLGSG